LICPYCTDLKEAFKDSPDHPLVKEMEVEELTPEHEHAHRDSGPEFVKIIDRLEKSRELLVPINATGPIESLDKALHIMYTMRDTAKPYGYWPEE
jgi:hypothetical protein